MVTANFFLPNRYGLPVNFQAMLLHPHKKNTKRLRDVLNQLYGHLDSSAVQGSGAHDVRIGSDYTEYQNLPLGMFLVTSHSCHLLHVVPSLFFVYHEV